MSGRYGQRVVTSARYDLLGVTSYLTSQGMMKSYEIQERVRPLGRCCSYEGGICPGFWKTLFFDYLVFHYGVLVKNNKNTF